MKFAIDGSNVLLGARLNNKPSTRVLARLLCALKDERHTFELFFDNSIEGKMRNEGLSSEWSAFQNATRRAGINPTFAARADDPIQRFCRDFDAAVINHNDKMDSWRHYRPRAYRARVYRKKNVIDLSLKDDASGKPLLSVAVHGAFEFGDIQFPSLAASNVVVEHLIARDTTADADETVPAQGTLLILALDASQSMLTTKSFDGRRKCDHLNEIVKAAIERFKGSRIRDTLYLAILRFETDVSVLRCSTTGTPFASVNDWAETLNTFDYLIGINPGQTNLRLALQRAKEVIQDTIGDEDSVQDIADEWRATVVLITDGKHEVTRNDGTTESDADVAPQAVDIHQGLSGLTNSRIDVGCVGIGTDVNSVLLSSIASECTPTQRRIAANAGIGHLLHQGRLFINVDSEDSKFVEAIRTFIDVASSRI